MPILSIHHLSFSYNEQPLLRGVSLDIHAGEFFTFIGPNGVGKSTLLRLITGYLRPREGDVRLEGKLLTEYSQEEIARKIAIVPQFESNTFPFSVQEVVLMGRAPYLRGFGFESKFDKEIARRAMRLTDITHLASRPVTKLSGGEAHRVAIARALAQQTPILLLDEPAAHLDIQHQLELFDLLAALHQSVGTTIICVSHDINLAARYSSKIALMHGGKILSMGKPEDVITKDHLFSAFHVRTEITSSHGSTFPQVYLQSGNLSSEIAAMITPIEQSLPNGQNLVRIMNPVRNIKIMFASVVGVEVLLAVLMTFIRYSNQHLSLMEFDPLATANLLPLVLTSMLLVSVGFHIHFARMFERRAALMLLSLSVLSCILLFGAFHPDFLPRVVALTGFIVVKFYQIGASLMRHFYSKLRPINIGLRSSIAAILLLASLLSFTLLRQSWREGNVAAPMHREYRAAIVSPYAHREYETASRVRIYQAIIEELYGKHRVRNIVLHDRSPKQRSIFFSSLRTALLADGIPDSTISNANSNEFPAQPFPKFLRTGKLVEALVITDQSNVFFLQEEAVLHRTTLNIIGAAEQASTWERARNRLVECIRVLYFWMFGMNV